MAKGLTLQQAIDIIDRISSSDADHRRFHDDMPGFLRELGIDGEDALNSCMQIEGGGTLRSPTELKAVRDAMIGRLLTGHLAQSVHNVE